MPSPSHLFDGAGERRLEPLLRPYFALKAENVRVFPSAHLAHHPHRLLNMLGIGIALFDQRHRKAVGAKHQGDLFGIRKLIQHTVDPLDDPPDVVGMIEEMLDDVHRNLRLIEAIPFLQAATRGGKGIMRVERQQDEFIVRGAFQRRNRFLRARIPIAHGDDRASRHVAAQRSLHSLGLPLGKTANGRPSANFGIVLAHLLRARGGDQLRQRLAGQKRPGEINNVRIAEQVIEERLDGGLRVRTAQLEQNHRDFFGFPHDTFRHQESRF